MIERTTEAEPPLPHLMGRERDDANVETRPKKSLGLAWFFLAIPACFHTVYSSFSFLASSRSAQVPMKRTLYLVAGIAGIAAGFFLLFILVLTLVLRSKIRKEGVGAGGEYLP